MSAVSNLTYVWIRDTSVASDSPVGDSVTIFSNYNEAMSWGKWISVSFIGSTGSVEVWNYNGNSGSWRSGAFTPKANTNWP